MDPSLKVKLTQRYLAAIKPTAKLFYIRDALQPGLIVAVTPGGVISFQLYRKFKGAPKRVTLGKWPELSVTEARRLAQAAVAKMLKGIDPVAEKRADRNRGVTLADAFAAYFKARKLTPNTMIGYQNIQRQYLDSWQARPLTSITRVEIARRHQDISAQYPAQANKVMRILRAVFNFARGEYLDEHGRPLLPDNPVGILSHRRQWNRENQRSDCIRPQELVDWWRALPTAADPVTADYLRLILLTGLRRREAAALRWANVDFKARTLTVTATKNGRDHTLPLSDYLIDLLTRRRDAAPGDFVFPGTGGSGHIEQPKNACYRLRDNTGVDCSVHGLRRTFASIAESLDIPGYSLKRLLNHATRGDVTANHYLVIDIERLRGHMQRITDYVLKAAGEVETAPVILFPAGQGGDLN